MRKSFCYIKCIAKRKIKIKVILFILGTSCLHAFLLHYVTFWRASQGLSSLSFPCYEDLYSTTWKSYGLMIPRWKRMRINIVDDCVASQGADVKYAR